MRDAGGGQRDSAAVPHQKSDVQASSPLEINENRCNPTHREAAALDAGGGQRGQAARQRAARLRRPSAQAPSRPQQRRHDAGAPPRQQLVEAVPQLSQRRLDLQASSSFIR